MTSARETQDPLTATADCQQAIVGAVELTYTLPYELLSADHYEEVIAEVDEAFAELGSRRSDLGSELYRIKGEAILGRDCAGSPEAVVCFRTAIATARNQESRLLELRATVSLARMLRDSLRRQEARTMLADNYNWFTEANRSISLASGRNQVDRSGPGA
jgi:hypothetical protein